jgi:hypothetical protein
MTKLQNNIIFNVFIICILCFPSLLLGQESLEPVSINPKLTQLKMSLKSNATSNAGVLPFFDDFSYVSDSVFYPNSIDWLDRKVYINNNYCVDPISIGVATFDALDQNGKIYEKAQTNLITGADTLTSRSINLKNYTIADSVYLSFYYQAGGYGEKPEKKDSLLVQFFSSKLNYWKRVWFIQNPDEEDSVRPFKLVMLKLDDTIYFDSVFQFRFINYVSVNIANNAPGMNTNGDIWNIDYVYMNTHRSFDDTVFNDIAIVEPILPFLKKFNSIPWKHYKDFFHEVNKDKFYLKIFNHYYGNASVNDVITIRDVYGKFDFEPINTTIDVEPVAFSTFLEDCQNLTSDETDSALFQIKAQIKTDDTIKGNNTVISYQNFSNFYAYDDGSAEYGYGLRGDNITLATVAYKIDGYKPDTLVAVKIYFNNSVDDKNVVNFNLMVWDEQNKTPGDSIAGKRGCTVTIKDGFNNFALYKLDTPIVVPAKYYVGWQQLDETFLNVGYDRNRNATNYIYYNTEGTKNGWLQSELQKKGALMIRPIYGSAIPSKSLKVEYEKVNVYPNPTSNWLNFNFDESVLIQSPLVMVLDLNGNIKIKQRINSNSINIQQLKPGIYFVRVQTSSGKQYNSKLIKQ